jgi:hypothetical protein
MSLLANAGLVALVAVGFAVAAPASAAPPALDACPATQPGFEALLAQWPLEKKDLDATGKGASHYKVDGLSVLGAKPTLLVATHVKGRPMWLDVSLPGRPTLYAAAFRRAYGDGVACQPSGECDWLVKKALPAGQLGVVTLGRYGEYTRLRCMYKAYPG